MEEPKSENMDRNISSHQEEPKCSIFTETFYLGKLFQQYIDIIGNDDEELESGSRLRKFFQPSGRKEVIR